MTIEHDHLTEESSDDNADDNKTEEKKAAGPLPSARTRKNTIKTRGTRVVKGDEDSTDGEKTKDKEESRRRRKNTNRMIFTKDD